MRKPLVAGNWKMFGSKELVAQLVQSVAASAEELNGVDIAIFPPAVFVPLAGEMLEGSSAQVGGQNAYLETEGAFTGEVAPEMYGEFGCKMVLVGHSERRTLFGETDEVVAKKFKAIQSAGLIPVLCVGETLEQRESGKTNDVVAAQVEAVVELCGIESFTNSVLAYEPVWAIGTGKTASPEQAQEVHAYLRELLAAKNSDVAEKIRILYGGSVKAANAESIFQQADVDGGLVGGASLIAEDFAAICRAAV